MPRPKGSGKTAGSGRKKGTPNKIVTDVRELAQGYGPEAITTLVELMRDADFETVRVAAAKELLDRAYGRPAQIVDAAVTIGLSEELKELMRRYDGQSRALPSGALRGPGMAPRQHLLDS